MLNIHLNIAYRLRWFVLYLMLVITLSSCSHATTRQENITLTSSGIRNMLVLDLMSIYGAAVRSEYRSDNSFSLSESALKEIEKEIDRRNLVNLKQYEEIEKGLLYLNMPIPQLFASVDNLKERESMKYEGYFLKVYEGDFNKRSYSTPVRGNGPTVAFSCNEKIIGLTTVGVTTIETYIGVENSKSKVQTNFPTGYFDDNSPESRKWKERGRTLPKPQQIYMGAGGWNLILSLKRESLNNFTKRINYSMFKKYLERRC